MTSNMRNHIKAEHPATFKKEEQAKNDATAKILAEKGVVVVEEDE